jgi:hypothetical protein
LNVRSALLTIFAVLTIVFASTTIYESGIRTTLTSTSTSTSTATSVSTTTSTTTQTTTITSTLDLTKALTDAYLSHIGAIESQNATALAAQYETNATLLYASQGGVFPSSLDGSVNGIANITRFYEGSLQENENNSQYFSCLTCITLIVPFAVANETISVTVSSNEKAGNVTSDLVFYSAVSGVYVQGVGLTTAAAYAMGFNISYVLKGDRWLISTESQAYIYVDKCLTTYLSPDGSIFYCPGPYR